MEQLRFHRNAGHPDLQFYLPDVMVISEPLPVLGQNPICGH